MKKLLISIAIIFFYYLTFSQESRKTFFLDGNENNISDSYTIFNIETNCNCIKQIGLFSKIDTTTLCKLENDWIIKNNNSWKVFWTKESKKIKVNDLFWFDSLKEKLIWGEVLKMDGEDIYTFYFSPIDVSISTEIIYYFDPNEGIIGYNLDGDMYFLQGRL